MLLNKGLERCQAGGTKATTVFAIRGESFSGVRGWAARKTALDRLPRCHSCRIIRRGDTFVMEEKSLECLANLSLKHEARVREEESPSRGISDYFDCHTHISYIMICSANHAVQDICHVILMLPALLEGVIFASLSPLSRSICRISEISGSSKKTTANDNLNEEP